MTPTNGSYNGVGNTNGFTFSPNFQYTFTQSGISGTQTGGSSQSILYQNVNDANGVNGNNLQVKVALLGSANPMDGSNSNLGFDLQQTEPGVNYPCVVQHPSATRTARA